MWCYLHLLLDEWECDGCSEMHDVLQHAAHAPCLRDQSNKLFAVRAAEHELVPAPVRDFNTRLMVESRPKPKTQIPKPKTQKQSCAPLTAQFELSTVPEC